MRVTLLLFVPLVVACARAAEPVPSTSTPSEPTTAAAFWIASMQQRVPPFTGKHSLQMELDMSLPRSPSTQPMLDGTWEQFLALVAISFNTVQASTVESSSDIDCADDAELAAFLAGGFVPYIGLHTVPARSRIMETTQWLVAHETDLYAVMEWAAPVLPQLMERHDRARSWLEHLWWATQGEYRASSDPLAHHLHYPELRDRTCAAYADALARSFQQLYASQGDTLARRNLAHALQFHIARLAVAFGHPDALEWCAVVRRNLWHAEAHAMAPTYLRDIREIELAGTRIPDASAARAEALVP
ncbi:MAG: hypothetical protein Q7T01_02770 [bacterium]|nr:hypothetical protein [bacterium]